MALMCHCAVFAVLRYKLLFFVHVCGVALTFLEASFCIFVSAYSSCSCELFSDSHSVF